MDGAWSSNDHHAFVASSQSLIDIVTALQNRFAGGVGKKVTGGAVTVTSGSGTSTSSGAIVIKSANAGAAGVSGKLSFSTGTTSSGNTGAVQIGSGAATAGAGGAVSLSVGSGTSGAGGALPGGATGDIIQKPAQAEVELNIQNGYIVGATVVNGGSGFTGLPDITINSDTGAGAKIRPSFCV